jgi:hypothetical protein
MTTKAERRAAAQAEINERFHEVAPAHRPSPWQYQLWALSVIWDDGCDDDGWWEGHCPIRKGPGGHRHPARFNFSKDVMQCNAPDSCHEGKNMISLGNVMLMAHV